MSKLSIYETGWINLVFENRNKEYGAYQLRRDYVKSSLNALFTGIVFVTVLGFLSKITWFAPNPIQLETQIPPIIDEELIVTNVYIPERKNNNIPEIPSKTTEAPIIKDNLTNPIIVHSTESFPEITKNKEITNQTTSASDSQGANFSNSNSGSSDGAGYVEPTDYGNSIVNATSLDKLPEFPGGIAKFYSYVGDNFEKPEIEDNESIRVFVNFIIEKDGSMTGIQVKNDPGHGIGKEAIRVLKSLKTKWIPGMVNSKAVRTAYNLPITILLE